MAMPSNEAYKERWAEAAAEYGGDVHQVPKDVARRLQEEYRLEWVVWVKGEQKNRIKDPKDAEQEAEGAQEEAPGDADGTPDRESGGEQVVVTPAGPVEEVVRAQRKSKRAPAAAKKPRSTRKKGR